MTKQEIIKQAYGEYWDNVSEHVDENGWCDTVWFSIKTPFEKIPDSYESKEDFRHIRPKSLQYIEDNNGWKKITGDHHLPDEDTFFWVIENGKISRKVFNHRLPSSVKNWMDNVTHYKPIEKPKPPIY